MPNEITPTSHEHWLKLRHEDITSSESAALFGLSPYATAYELYFLKTSEQPVEIESNERMKWGSRLEHAIALGVAEDYGLIVRPFKTYMRHSEVERMGSSFDFLITGVQHGFDNEFTRAFQQHGQGILEIKNVDGLVFREQWDDEEAPTHIEVQVQHQMEVADMEWTMIAPLVGGNTMKPLLRERDRELGSNIKAEVISFWQNVAKNTPPKPDFEKDARFITALYASADGQPLDARGNNQITFLCGAYLQAKEDVDAAEKRKEATKAELLTLIGNAPKVIGNGFTISAGEVKGTPPTVITPEMVGQTYGGRRGYRGFRINEVKVKG